jgi:thioredoxin reductase
VPAELLAKILILPRREEIFLSRAVAVEEILIGVGRAPNVEGLGLEAASVAYDKTGVKVNDRLQTTNRRIYAAGDICSALHAGAVDVNWISLSCGATQGKACSSTRTFFDCL